MTDQPRAFISYARRDGEAFANALRSRLEQEQPEITIWQDRAQLEGGIGWWRQIAEALDSVDFLILILTPVAVHSPVIRQEWRYARQRGVCVYPVKGVMDTELDYRSLPKWMRKVHFFDLDREWDTFVNYLKSPCHAARIPFMAPDLPEGYVERPGLTERLLGCLIDKSHEHFSAINITLYGAGGLGKSTLAVALCHEEDIVGSFDDGILWVTLGQNPNIQDSLTKLYAALSGLLPCFVDKDDASFYLSEKLEDKNCLIVIDDVWDPAHLETFMRGGRSCSRLITTRNFEIAAETSRVEIDQMSASEAVQMLISRFSGMPTELNPFKELARRLGYWPLLLELANAALRQRIERGDTIENALLYLNRTLRIWNLVDGGELLALRGHRSNVVAIAVSSDGQFALSASSDDTLRCWPLSEVGVADPPDGLVITDVAYWLRTVVLTPDGQKAITGADDGSLRAWNMETGYLSRIFEGHVDRINAVAVTRDGRRAVSASNDRTLRVWDLTSGGLQRARKGHTKRFRALVSTEDGSMAVSTADDRKLKVWETATRRKIRSFAGYLPFAVSSDGRYIVSVSPRRYASLQVMNCKTWTVHQVLKGHTDVLRAIVIMPDSRQVVSASDDCTIRSWDMSSGYPLISIKTQKDYVRTLAALPDGRGVISGSYGGIIQVWDLDTGCEVRRLAGHTARVNAVAVPPDGKVFISAASDNTLRIWSLTSGVEEIVVDAHEGEINEVVVDKDGKYAVSVSDDCTVKLWRLRDLNLIATFTGDSPMRVCAMGEERVIIAGDQSGCLHFLHK